MKKTTEERLSDIERQIKAFSINLDLVLNYCRSIAQSHLSEQKIKDIESLIGNGHD